MFYNYVSTCSFTNLNPMVIFPLIPVVVVVVAIVVVVVGRCAVGDVVWDGDGASGLTQVSQPLEDLFYYLYFFIIGFYFLYSILNGMERAPQAHFFNCLNQNKDLGG